MFLHTYESEALGGFESLLQVSKSWPTWHRNSSWLFSSANIAEQPLASPRAKSGTEPAAPAFSCSGIGSERQSERQCRAAARCHLSCVYSDWWVVPKQDAASLWVVTLLQLIFSASQRKLQVNKSWVLMDCFATVCEKCGCWTKAIPHHPPVSSCLAWSLCILLLLLP